jgi:hypothetical protein
VVGAAVIGGIRGLKWVGLKGGNLSGLGLWGSSEFWVLKHMG